MLLPETVCVAVIQLRFSANLHQVVQVPAGGEIVYHSSRPPWQSVGRISYHFSTGCMATTTPVMFIWRSGDFLTRIWLGALPAGQCRWPLRSAFIAGTAAVFTMINARGSCGAITQEATGPDCRKRLRVLPSLDHERSRHLRHYLFPQNSSRRWNWRQLGQFSSFSRCCSRCVRVYIAHQQRVKYLFLFSSTLTRGGAMRSWMSVIDSGLWKQTSYAYVYFRLVQSMRVR